MWQKLSRHKLLLALFSALPLIFAYAPFNLCILGFLTPFFFVALTINCKTFKEGFKWGFLVSVFLMLGGFYWVTYVIHVFGYLPWSVSALLFLGFCGIGALDLPLFVGTAAMIHTAMDQRPLPRHWPALWWSLGLPSLLTIYEYLIPKLFPWNFGHALYKLSWLTQISEITGSIFLSFALFSLGAVVAARLVHDDPKWHPTWPGYAIAGGIWFVIISFGACRMLTPSPAGQTLTVGLIQANIGSLEKVEAQKGIHQKVRYVLNRFKFLSELSLRTDPKPDLLLWPETAVPFQLDGSGVYQDDIKDEVKKWGIPLITGAYAQSPYHAEREYNAAWLLEPTGDVKQPLKLEMYPKNVLLAFGEYMPFGDQFPILYKLFPQVSNFELGNVQKVFTLKNGTRLGMSICYEAIIPSFMRRVAKQGSHVLVNLTNDSWFGPTSEPYQHAQLATFRSIETRMPMIRITNTGTSFVVDDRGRMSETTPVYKEAALNLSVTLPAEPPLTFYVKYGDWFILWCVAIFVALLMLPLLVRTNVSVPV